MMHDDMFAPQSVDEQVDRLLYGSADETSLSPAEALVQQLRAVYEEDQDSVGRVWARLAERVSEEEVYAWQREALDALPSNGSSLRPEIQLQRARAPMGTARAVQVTATVVTAVLIASLLLTFHLISSERANPTPATQIQSTPSGIYVTADGGVTRLNSQTRQVMWHVSVLWLSYVGAAYPYAPLVADNTVFVSWGAHLLALNATTGAQRWSHVFSGADLGSYLPFMDGNVLYVPNPRRNGSGTVSGTLFAVNSLTGAIISTYTGEEAGGQVRDNVLYYVTGNFIYARQLPDDTPLWQRQVIPYSNPYYDFVLYSMALHGVLYVETGLWTDSSVTMYGFNLHDGTQLWKFQLREGNPIFGGGMMYICSNSDTTVPDATFVLYAFTITTATPRLAWQHNFGKSLCLTSVPVAGALYVTGTGTSTGEKHSTLTALRVSDGSVLWQMQADFVVGVDSSGTLYVVQLSGQDSIDNTSVLYGVNPRTGAVLWQIPDGSKDSSPWGVTVV